MRVTQRVWIFNNARWRTCPRILPLTPDPSPARGEGRRNVGERLELKKHRPPLCRFASTGQGRVSVPHDCKLSTASIARSGSLSRRQITEKFRPEVVGNLSRGSNNRLVLVAVPLLGNPGALHGSLIPLTAAMSVPARALLRPAEQEDSLTTNRFGICTGAIVMLVALRLVIGWHFFKRESVLPSGLILHWFRAKTS